MKPTFKNLLLLASMIAQLAIGVTIAEGAPPAAEPIVYIVRRGDTLSFIAWRYGARISAIAQVNNLANYNLIYVGQRLIIPSQEGAPSPQSNVYIVQRGDTLSTIARRYGTTANVIAQANRIHNPQLIYVGQRLLIPSIGPSPGSAPGAHKWIDINLTTQTLVAYEGDQPVLTTLVSTGKAGTPTPTGRFRIGEKYRYRDMAGGVGAYRYHYRNVPHVMFFHGAYSLHGTYWHSNFGHPMSHGCVNMSLGDAAWLYNWAPLGTLVVIHR